MYYNITFQELSKLAMEQTAKRKPVTLEEAKAQVRWLKSQSESKNKKKKN